MEKEEAIAKAKELFYAKIRESGIPDYGCFFACKIGVYIIAIAKNGNVIKVTEYAKHTETSPT